MLIQRSQRCDLLVHCGGGGLQHIRHHWHRRGAGIKAAAISATHIHLVTQLRMLLSLDAAVMTPPLTGMHHTVIVLYFFYRFMCGNVLYVP